MDIQQAKLAVIAAGKRLVDCGLIARTWGNVSARVSDTQFVITPSGKAYDGLTPDDIVLVNIADMTHEGDVKPSSEKAVHAKAYALRPEVGFVIHTHQYYASIVSVMGKTVAVDEQWRDTLGDSVPMAAYGLPGTGKLTNGVTNALAGSPKSKAVILAHHGTICVGTDEEDTFNVVDVLEQQCRAFLQAHGVEDLPAQTEPSVVTEREDGSVVLHSKTPAILQVSQTSDKVLPYLDDFAQIAGVKLTTKLGKRSAVLLPGEGALCYGSSLDEAQAVETVVDKNCAVALAADKFSNVKPLGWLDSTLMRFIYVKKYSKKK
ncbi:MAG: class II aldolase/adducin family protein [Oscillospiraceae bacterium]|nr:class II aldolase/adducin family protein [Oscillospiraceae bacterium]